MVPPPLDALLNATASPHPRVRAAAIHGLGNLSDLSTDDDLRCVDRLVELTSDEQVRAAACENIGYRSASRRRAMPSLLALLAGEVDDETRTAVIQTLGNCFLNERDAPPEVVAAVQRLVGHPTPGVSGMARWCLQVLTPAGSPRPEASSGPASPGSVPSREDLQVRLAELQARAEALQKQARNLRRSTLSGGQMAFRWALLLAGLAVLFGGGYWLAGGWGILGAVGLLVVAFFGYALLPPVIRGRAIALGDLRVKVEPPERRVFYRATVAPEMLPATILAEVDRRLLRGSLGGGRLAQSTELLLAEVRRLATERKADRAVPETAWQALPGEANQILLTLARDRLGLTYSFTSSIGGKPTDPEEEEAVTLALVGAGLRGPEGARLATALLAYGDRVALWGRSARAFRAAARSISP
jgi:hypothetical protein